MDFSARERYRGDCVIDLVAVAGVCVDLEILLDIPGIGGSVDVTAHQVDIELVIPRLVVAAANVDGRHSAATACPAR